MKTEREEVWMHSKTFYELMLDGRWITFIDDRPHYDGVPITVHDAMPLEGIYDEPTELVRKTVETMRIRRIADDEARKLNTSEYCFDIHTGKITHILREDGTLESVA